MKIYIVNGAPGSGKTTFENYICEKIKPYGTQFSTIDCIKEIAYQCGWEGTKTPKDRKMLSDMKDILTEWGDVPAKAVDNSINNFRAWLVVNDYPLDKSVVFIDCREPKEIAKLKKIYDAKTVLIRRESAENSEKSNHADANVLKFDYDLILYNNNTIKDFYKTIDEFMKGENIYA